MAVLLPVGGADSAAPVGEPAAGAVPLSCEVLALPEVPDCVVTLFDCVLPPSGSEMEVPGSVGPGATVGRGAGVLCDGSEVAPGAVTPVGAGSPGWTVGSAGLVSFGGVFSAGPVGPGASGLPTGPGLLSFGSFGCRHSWLFAGRL